MIKKSLFAFFLILMVAAPFFYARHTHSHVSTNEATVVQMTPRITNEIAELDKVNNPFLEKNETSLDLAKMQPFLKHSFPTLFNGEEFWIDAHFKETELKKIRAGQKAKITFDLYPQHKFKGIVESINSKSPVFSLAPTQTGPGNWIKMTEQVPVHIKVIDFDRNYPLRMGISATVSIEIR